MVLDFQTFSRRYLCYTHLQFVAATYRILSIDGGGIRGVIPAAVLAKLEEICSRPIAQLFDLIVGTSTGGILALGLTTPGADGRTPARSAKDMLRLYAEEGAAIFPGPPTFAEQRRNPFDTAMRVTQRWGALWGGNARFAGGARYFASGLDKLLETSVGDAHINAALADVIVTSYDMANDEPILFSNRSWPGCTTDVKVRVAARATAAAPTYFEPQAFSSEGKERALVDGGVYLGSPALLAYVFGSAAAEGKPLLLVSLGTGTRNPTSPRTYSQVTTANWLTVARMVLDAGMSGGGKLGHTLLSQLLGSERYWRIETTLGNCNPAMDDATAINLDCLRQRAAELVKRNHSVLEQIRGQLLLPA